MNRCYLTSSGSEATETAIKLARQYHRLRGDHHRYKFVSRYGGAAKVYTDYNQMLAEERPDIASDMAINGPGSAS